MAMKHGGRGPGHLSRWTAATSPIPYLFASGSQGAWFDFTDTSTWYQDAAGTTPAATLGDVVGLVLDKSRGTSFAARRNYLNYTQDFSNAAWVKTTCTVTASATTAPDGTSTGTLLTQTGSGGRAVQTVTVSAGVFTYSIYVKKFGAIGNIGVIIRNGTTATNYGTTWRFNTLDFGGSDPNLTTSYTDVGGGWYRLSLRCDTAFSAGNSALVYLYAGALAGTTDSVYAWGAQLELGAATAYQACTTVPVTWLGNHASQATTAQKPLRARIPLGGRRNMLTYTEDFSNAAWVKYNSGTATGKELTFATSSSAFEKVLSGFCATGDTVVLKFKASIPSGSVSMRTRLADNADGTPNSTSTHTITATPTYFTHTWTIGAAYSGGMSCFFEGNAVIVAGTVVTLDEVQLERAATPTAYQKVVADWDVTESGVTSIPALYYDGSDDSLATAAIDFATCTSDGAARRNLLLYPTDYGNAVYALTSGTTVVGDTATFTTTAYRYQPVSIGSSVLGRTFTLSVTLSSPSKANIALRLTGSVTNTDATVSLITLTPTSTRYSVTRTFTSTDTSIDTGLDNRALFGAGIAGDVVVTDWQFEESATATAFQNIGTDTMTVFAGVEKLSDAGSAVLAELSANYGLNNGSFAVWSPLGAAANYGFSSRGTLAADPYTGNSYPAPSAVVLTATGNISGDSAILRVNAVQAATSASNQGTGNYGNYPLYLGRRAGSSLPFKGYMIGHMVIVGKLANASEVAAVEATERAATGAY